MKLFARILLQVGAGSALTVLFCGAGLAAQISLAPIPLQNRANGIWCLRIYPVHWVGKDQQRRHVI